MRCTVFVICWMIHLKQQFELFFDAFCSSDSALFRVLLARWFYLFLHISLIRAIEQWIAGIISTAKDSDYMIPFHLPHKKCVAGKHRSLRDVIYNNISMAESWTWDSPPCCNCSLLRQAFLRSTTSRPFLRRYKWGVNLCTSSLPIAYILPKQKKDFKAARPIISYIHFLCAKLFRATAIALDLILRSVCPRSFALDTLPSILQKLTVFLQRLPDDADPIGVLSFTIKIFGWFLYVHSSLSYS